MYNKTIKISRFLLVFVLVAGWIFSGFPRIWPLGELGVNKIRIPPEIQEAQAASQEFTATGLWTCPSGVTSVDVECWGGGGAGGGTISVTDGGGGGGGGAYSKKINISVTPGNYTVNVGTGGSGVSGDNGTAGGDSWFIDTSTVLAKGGGGGYAPVGGPGGVAGTGGAAADGVGDASTKFSGGNGGAGCNCPKGGGGGGGGGAGDAADGGAGVLGANKVPGAGGTGGTTGGGDGGAGGYLENGYPGTAPGGAGGGSSGNATPLTGGAGADGKCILTWTAELSTAIEIRAQNYTTLVSNITFPEDAPGATVSQPYNDIDGSGNPQTFGGAGVAKPVVTLYNGGASTLTIWYNITTFTNGVVSNEYYLINDKGAACADVNAITNAVTFDTNITTGTTIAQGAGNEKDLYLKIALSASAGKTGTSTLTILGETP